MKKAKIALVSATALAIISASTIQAQTSTTTLKIVTPSEGQTIYGNRIPILISVENFEVVDYLKYPQAASGQGHIHVWLDEINPAAQTARQVASDTTTYTDVPYGSHTLVAELVNNNHTSLTPPVKTTVNFKSAPASSPAPAAPVSGFDKNTALVILVVVALVIIAAWWYTKEEEEPKSKVERQSRKSTRKASRRRKK